MEVGGFFRIGPNTNGDIAVTRITNIVSVNEVDVTEVIYDFAEDDNIYYWRSGIQPENFMPITEGNAADPTAQPLGDGPKETEFMINTKINSISPLTIDL